MVVPLAKIPYVSMKKNTPLPDNIPMPHINRNLNMSYSPHNNINLDSGGPSISLVISLSTTRTHVKSK